MTRRYWLAIFTGTTWEEFLKHGGNVMGFSEKRKTSAQRINKGDYLICYLSKLSRFIGILEIDSELYFDNSTIWEAATFPNRLKVKLVEKLEPKHAVPVLELRNNLSIFKKLKNQDLWSGFFMGAPREFEINDGEIIIKAIKEAKKSPVERPYDQKKYFVK